MWLLRTSDVTERLDLRHRDHPAPLNPPLLSHRVVLVCHAQGHRSGDYFAFWPQPRPSGAASGLENSRRGGCGFRFPGPSKKWIRTVDVGLEGLVSQIVLF